MSKTCKNCKWWRKADFIIHKSPVLGANFSILGYCEPPHTKLRKGLMVWQWKGLTDEDYSCFGYEDKTDDN